MCGFRSERTAPADGSGPPCWCSWQALPG